MRNERRLARVEIRVQAVVEYEIDPPDPTVGIMGSQCIINNVWLDHINLGSEKIERLDIPTKFIDDSELDALQEHLLESLEYED